MAKKTARRSTEDLATLDALLEDQGTQEEFQAIAIKEVLAWQLREAMASEGLTQVAMARKMRTSTAQLRRLLNPADGNVTLATLQRAAETLGRKVRLELV